MKLICILLLGLLSSPTFAKDCNSIIHRYQDTFFSSLKQASNTLKFVPIMEGQEFEQAVETLRETIDRNYLIYLTHLFKLQDGLEHNRVWEIELNGKFYHVIRARGLVIVEREGPVIMNWPTFDYTLPAVEGDRRFRATRSPGFTYLHFKDERLALTIFTKFLNAYLSADEMQKFKEESETRIVYSAWLNRFIDSLRPPDP